MANKHDCVPFLKWAGGKRWFAARCPHLLPTQFNRYIEPFLGSGALFFALKPCRAILADINPDLIKTYAALRRNWRGVARILQTYQEAHSRTFYYSVRDSQPRSVLSRAARFIYLNRTCWNGLYRVNRHGHFNVPVGTKENVVLRSDNFRMVGKLLRPASLLASDFEPVIRLARDGDLIFADPPYVTSHSQNGFLKYNGKLFSWSDQIRLRDVLLEAKKSGAIIIATNADTPSIRKLYSESFKIFSLSRSSVIAADSKNRRQTSELIICSQG
jgi:DNA adenine methylase